MIFDFSRGGTRVSRKSLWYMALEFPEVLLKIAVFDEIFIFHSKMLFLKQNHQKEGSCHQKDHPMALHVPIYGMMGFVYAQCNMTCSNRPLLYYKIPLYVLQK